MAGIISTSFIIGAGLKKWIPNTREGSLHEEAIAVTGSEEVLLW
jgi:hypothetical protein